MSLEASSAGQRFGVGFAGARWPYRVLAVESPAGLTRETAAAMLDRGVELHLFGEGAAALLSFTAVDPAAVVVPTDMAGVDLLRFVRAVVTWCEVPVVIGWAGGAESHEAAYTAMDSGARAMLALPFTAQQLVATLAQMGLQEAAGAAPLVRGPISLDRLAHRVLVDGAEPRLSPADFSLLEHLMAEAPRVVSMTEIAAVIGSSIPQSGDTVNIRKSIERLRKRLLDVTPDQRNFIRTVTGQGYRLDVEEVFDVSPGRAGDREPAESQ